MTLLFPIGMMLLSAGASVVYGFEGDWRRAVYWAAATIITLAVTI